MWKEDRQYRTNARCRDGQLSCEATAATVGEVCVAWWMMCPRLSSDMEPDGGAGVTCYRVYLVG